MTIETAGKSVQTQLIEESKGERLLRLYELRQEIAGLRSKRQVHNDSANALKNTIKTLEEEELKLLNLISSGQGTLIPVAVHQVEEEDNEPVVTDEELAEFETDEVQGAPDQFAEDLKKEYEEEMDEILEGIEESSDLDTLTEKVDEIIQESLLYIKRDHWIITNYETFVQQGVIKSKTAPKMSLIFTLPVYMRFEDKVSYIIMDYKLSDQDETAYEVFVKFLNDSEREEIKNRFPMEGDGK